MIKLSIILPVYNVEKYIEKCIRSLNNQDIPQNEYEIIAVNDGSTDNSPLLIQKLKTEFNNIILINKQNGGLSSARNCGLKHANGKYIWFVDSDDYVEANVLKRLLIELNKNNLDLLSFNIFDIWNKEEEEGFKIDLQPKNIISGEEYIKKYSIGKSAWFFIVKKDILIYNNIFFTENIIHEDYEFTLKLYQHIKRMAFVPIRVYNYVHRDGSITTTKTNEQIIKSIHSWQTIISNELTYFNDDSSYSKYAQTWINNHKFSGICVLFFNELTLDVKKKEFKTFKQIGAFDIGKTKLENLKQKLICKILQHSWLYYCLMHFFRVKK